MPLNMDEFLFKKPQLLHVSINKKFNEQNANQLTKHLRDYQDSSCKERKQRSAESGS